ncbi:MAG: DUF697 domain-containing protein [Rhodospirillales bacterium]
MKSPKSTTEHEPASESVTMAEALETTTAPAVADPAPIHATESVAAPAETTETIAEASSAPDDDEMANRRRKAKRIMRRYMLFSGVAGLVPLPAVDVATVTGVQVKMLHAMTKVYGVPFNFKLARQLVLALVGGGGSVVLALPAASATKSVPVVGMAASFLLSPAFATASCYGTGKAFIGHFEAGGTLETFVPA